MARNLRTICSAAIVCAGLVTLAALACPCHATSMADLKRLPNGTPVTLTGVDVTAVFSNFFYVESEDRTCGIRVNLATATLGDRINLVGTLTTVGGTGERALLTSSRTSTSRARPHPMYMTNKALGGGTAGLNAGITGGQGLNNIGTLLSTTGKVTSAVSQGSGLMTLTIDDGSGVGVRASYCPGAFQVGQTVQVSGISSAYLADGVVGPAVLATGAETSWGNPFQVNTVYSVASTYAEPGLLRMNYTSGADQHQDYALIETPTTGTTWAVYLHGHGSYGDQLYVDPDIRRVWLPAFKQAGLGILACNLRDNAWMSPAAVADLHSLLGEIRSRYGATRFLIFGGSMGGTSTLIYSSLHPEDVTAAAAFCPATDLIIYYAWCRADGSWLSTALADAMQASYGGTPSVQQERFATNSTMLNVSKLTMPVYVAHGSADSIIPVSQSRALAGAMTWSSLFHYNELANGGHGIHIDAFPDGFAWVMAHIIP